MQLYATTAGVPNGSYINLTNVGTSVGTNNWASNTYTCSSIIWRHDEEPDIIWRHDEEPEDVSQEIEGEALLEYMKVAGLTDSGDR